MEIGPAKKIRVLIVDDSHVSQKFFNKLLSDDGNFELVGLASNGRQAIEAVVQYKPDVVSMDINMPVMDGVEATRHIMQTNPVPIVIVSSLYNASEQEMAVRVLEAGAVSIMPKPHGPGHPRHLFSSRQYLNMLRAMAEVKVVTRRNHLKHDKSHTNPSQTDQNNLILPQSAVNKSYDVVVIGASAGGPEAIKTIISSITPDFSLPILIVQHIDSAFAEAYASWLQSHTQLSVTLAGKNQPLLAGHVYLSPGDKHLIISSEGKATINDSPPVRGHRPSVAKLFHSAAEVYHKNVIAIILSGMGIDGVEELIHLKNIGALTLAQNEASCLVYGMPGEAVKRGAATGVMPPLDIARELNRIAAP